MVELKAAHLQPHFSQFHPHPVNFIPISSEVEDPLSANLLESTAYGKAIDLPSDYIRLTVDIKVLPMKKAVPIQERLDEIGRMLGGWIKSIRQR
jgi:hypothetical protein